MIFLDKRRIAKRKGQALVELALTLPLILLLILGAMDFGRLFYTKLVLTNAAREGANYLAYHPDDKEIAKQVAVEEAISLGMSLKIENVIIEPDDETCCDMGQPITVKATVTIQLIFGGFFQAIGLTESSSIDLNGVSKMMVQV